jgi:hypothetical protein
VANFVTEIGPELSNSQLGKYRSAISTTYDAAVGASVATLTGRSTLVVAMSFNMGNGRPWGGPPVGFDPAEALAPFLVMPDNADLSFADLNRKVIVLKRLFTGARGADLFSLVAGSSVNVVPGCDAHKPLLASVEGLVQKTSYFMNKSKKSRYQQASGGWSRPFDQRPLSADRLSTVMPRARAELVASKCCSIRAHFELERRLRVLAQALPDSTAVTDTVSTKCDRAFLRRTFLYNETAFPPTRATTLQFLTKTSLSNVIKNFHNAYLSSSCGRIVDGKDFEAKYWRHNFAVHAELVDCRGDRVARLTQEDPETMWRNHYGRVSVNPAFAARWAAKASSVGREHLTVDERLCV